MLMHERNLAQSYSVAESGDEEGRWSFTRAASNVGRRNYESQRRNEIGTDPALDDFLLR